MAVKATLLPEKRQKKDKNTQKNPPQKQPSTRNMSCFSLAREMNLATCSTWHWISQRASDSSCRPLAAARKSPFALLLTEAQHLWEMFKGAPACNRALPRAQLMSSTQEGWAEPAQGYLPVGGVCKLIREISSFRLTLLFIGSFSLTAPRIIV